MAIFVTGANGYLGSYVAARLLAAHGERLALLVRAPNVEQAHRRLWHAWQFHMRFEEFQEYLGARVDVYLGDITHPGMGLARDDYRRLVSSIDSVIHVAASLNRRSARKCFDVNLRGTLEVIEAARTANELQGLRRFSDVSTTAVAGERQGELVREDEAISWTRRDYDPYARTKKFCEHMVEKLLPDVPQTVFRPSMVIGDSRDGRTFQFDMASAVAMLGRMGMIPLRPSARQDIVPADYVGRAIADLHQGQPAHRIYHLSAGLSSETNADLMRAFKVRGKSLPHVFVPTLQRPFGFTASTVARTPRKLGLSGVASMMEVFWPYVVFDTVFDNTRVVQELGEAPAPFTSYLERLLDFCIENDFRFPHEDWPASPARAEVRPSAA